jgi:NAD(P)-dependent dehydrogenase (short-subunit alcohol dehydrogenase family)|tara:strand:+ start:9404 stop:10189 length:786 start_codon:yes stop_codon:yes gene_type:complete
MKIMINYQNIFKNKNKLAYVVGGSGRIGSEITVALLSSGAKTIVLDVKKKKNIFKKNCYFQYFDCSDTENLSNNFSKVLDKFGSPNIFINSSYPKTKDWPRNSFKDISYKSFKRNLDIHLNSYAWLAKLAAESMKIKKKGGSIIQLSSIYGVVAQDANIYKGTKMRESMTYALIKGGINNFTRQMASYYGKFNIRINSLCPGGVEDSNHNSKFLKNYKFRVPLKRLCKKSDVASTVLFLSSNASSYITGTNIMVDGGWTCI